jgi:2-hydroxy-3-keto-5-methylthiopentenyl-1-phosphate phosphatase
LTKTDILNEIIKKFSVNDQWIALENAWVNGEIGAKECLEGQLRGIKVSKKALEKFLTHVELDKHSYKVLSFLNAEGVKPVILSDNFSPIIEYVLKHHGIKDVKVYANALRFYKDHLIPSFPYDNPFCPSCAHCKKIHLTRNEEDSKSIVYVGDGRSDFCPAKVSDIVFAKDSLLQHLNQMHKPCIAYKDLETVYNYFKEAGDARAN